MMIKVNGKPYELTQASVMLTELLTDLAVDTSYMAVAVNKSIIAKSQYAKIKLCSGDEVDMLSPMQGG